MEGDWIHCDRFGRGPARSAFRKAPQWPDLDFGAGRGPCPDMRAPEIGYVNLYVSDLERSASFFGEVLGLREQHRDGEHGYASFSAGPISLGIAVVDPADEKTRGLVGRPTGFGFCVEDLVEAHRDLAARGVQFVMEPTRQPWGGFLATFADPDGNIFYLDQPGPH
jgi:predicted enzyme related to lactoylglutathione lyase